MEMDLIESIFKATFIPSLEYSALITYVISVWEGYLEETFIKYGRVSTLPYCEDIRKSEVLERVSNNSLPNSIKEKISSAIHLVGDSVVNWLESIFCRTLFSCRKDMSDYLKHTKTNPVKIIKWTKFGMIDEFKTWEAIVEQVKKEGYTGHGDHSYDALSYFIKSSRLCNETLIEKFWSHMSISDIKEYSRTYGPFRYLENYWATKLVGCSSSDAYFNTIVANQYSCKSKYLNPFLYGNPFRNLNEFTFVFSIVKKRYYAVEYFVNKLNISDLIVNVMEMTKALAREMVCNNCKCQNIFDCFCRKKLGKAMKVIWLLLSHLSNDEVLDVLKECSSYILRVFHVHPLVRIFFLDIWSIAEKFITPVDYLQVLTKVLSQIKKGRATVSLFKGLWIRTSLDMKKSSLGLLIGEENQQQIHQCQVRFCKAATLETLEVIFNDDELKKFKPGVNLTSQLLIENEKFEILNYWLEVTSSDFLEFKRKLFKTKGRAVFSSFLIKNDVDKVNLFLEWILESCCEEDKNKFYQIVMKNVGSDFCHVCLKTDKLQELEKFLNYFKSGSEDFVLAKENIGTWIKMLELVFPGKIRDFDGVCQIKRDVMKKLDYSTVPENSLNAADVIVFLNWGITNTMPKVDIIAFKDSILDIIGSKFFLYNMYRQNFYTMTWFFCDYEEYEWLYYDYKMAMVAKCGFRTLIYDDDENEYLFTSNNDEHFLKYEFLNWFFEDNFDIPRWNCLKESIVEDDDYCVDMCCYMIAKNDREACVSFLLWGFWHLFRKNNFQKKLNTFKKRVIDRLPVKFTIGEWQSAFKDFLGWGLSKPEDLENLKRMIFSKPFVRKCSDELWETFSYWESFLLNKNGKSVIVMDQENGERSGSFNQWRWEGDEECENEEEIEGEAEREYYINTETGTPFFP